MNTEQTESIRAMLLKRGFEEMRMKPGIFTKDRIPNMRLVDISKEPIQVCISNGVERFDEGHGISEIDEVRSVILNLSKSKGTKKESAGEVKKEPPAPDKMTEVFTNELEKLGATFVDCKGTPDTKPVLKIHKCRKCGIEVSGARALEMFQKDKELVCEDCEGKKEIKVINMVETKEVRTEALTPVTTISTNAIVRPAVSPQEAIAAWKEFNDLKHAVISDSDRQKIGGSTFIKKSGWRKLAAFFNLTDKITEEIQTPHPDGGWTWKLKVTAIAPNGRVSEGVGICSTSERKFAHVEHDTYATAHTRAKNRAISDMIAGGECSAEEVS